MWSDFTSTTSSLNKMQETRPSSVAQPIRGTLDGFLSLKRTDRLAISVDAAAVEQPSASTTSSADQILVQNKSSGLSDKGGSSVHSSERLGDGRGTPGDAVKGLMVRTLSYV